MIEKNLKDVRSRIESACQRAGRDPGDVCLVAVTKTVGADEIRELAKHGQRVFGENRVQSALSKHMELTEEGFEWHMIGHLQRNKVRDALKCAAMIHSVDSERLAAEIEKEASRLGRTVPVLIEANVSGEESKYGVNKTGAVELAKLICSMRHLKLQGLMTMAPIVNDPEETRPVFRVLRNLLNDLQTLNLPNSDLRHLSMGMTQDFEVAIEEGATIVRVGTALFK